MSDAVLVDTNVILDVTNADPSWVEWSRKQMELAALRLLINPMIYAELCYHAGEIREVEMMVTTLGLNYGELPREALFLAAAAFRHYRKQGGQKSSPLADFFIGAHAAALGIPILTRDTARYKSYFPTVELITP